MTILLPMQRVPAVFTQWLKRPGRESESNSGVKIDADLNLLFLHVFALRTRAELPLPLPLAALLMFRITQGQRLG
jgi:hypothetical protein